MGELFTIDDAGRSYFRQWVSRGVTNGQLSEAFEELAPFFPENMTASGLDEVIEMKFEKRAA